MEPFCQFWEGVSPGEGWPNEVPSWGGYLALISHSPRLMGSVCPKMGLGTRGTELPSRYVLSEDQTP